MRQGRSLWPIVARREFVERIRDRGFQVSTTITLLLLIGIVTISALFNRPTRFDLAVVGEGSDAIDVVLAARALDIGVDVHRLSDEAQAAGRSTRAMQTRPSSTRGAPWSGPRRPRSSPA